MKTRDRIALFYTIFRAIVTTPRIMVKDIAVLLGRSGRGRTKASASRQLLRMYAEKVSLYPQLVLTPFENAQVTTYFLRRTTEKDLTSTFYRLYHDDDIIYVLYLAGRYDFFVTSYRDDLTFDALDLEITSKSKLFTPVYTIPHGWKLSIKEAVYNFLQSPFEKGNIERVVQERLPWKDIDWEIFNVMKDNARKEFAPVGKTVGVFSNTVKRHFYNTILPCCTVAHYFFPLGYDHYRQIFLHLNTQYEKDIVAALSALPCTSYVFPVDTGLLVNLFHDNINDTMLMIQKMEEMGIVKNHLLYTPLGHGI